MVDTSFADTDSVDLCSRWTRNFTR